MKKKLYTASAVILFLVPSLVFSAASTSPVNTPTVGSGIPVNIGGFYDIVCEASNWVFAFVIILGVVSLLGGAVAFLASRGDEDRVSSARRYVTYSLIGVAVAILARSLIFAVGNFIGISSPSTEFFAC